MNIVLNPTACTGVSSDLLVIATGTHWHRGDVAALDRMVGGRLAAELRHHHFRGAEGETVWFQTQGRLPMRDVLVAGIGTARGPQTWYRLADTLVGQARNCRARTVVLACEAERLTEEALIRIVEGVHLSDYRFMKLKSSGGDRPRPLQKLTIARTHPDQLRVVAQAQAFAAATCYARDLINLPASIVTPKHLANEARRIGRAQGLRAHVLGPAAIQRAGMGALMGVAQGSAQPPRFIELIYVPRAHGSNRRVHKAVALAGKGITFDSGGLSIKPADAMQTQKRDMAGAAAVLAVMSVVRDLAVPVEVRAYIAASENMPGGRAIKPGDVVRAYNGKTIEVLNTDAEGRLVLADALSYAAAKKPDVLIDLATLTAAVRSALGPRYAAIMGTAPALVQALRTAAQASGENLWELPLVPEYRADLDSGIADLKNIGDGSAGTIVAGLFLREFVDTVTWAHIDFSSTVMADRAIPCHPRGATGFGVRTLLRYLLSLPM